MIYSNLTNQVQISPNSNARGNNRIERITPHCIVGQMSAMTCANLKNFKAGGCASANYIIGKDGELLLNVAEERRAWTSGGEKRVNGKTGRDNDYKAITFECASDAKSPYAFKPIVYEKLIQVCVDICKRYGRSKLLWFATPQEAEAYKVKEDEMILTWHRWYANKSCPGDWLYSRGKELADTVTARLGGQPAIITPSQPIQPTTTNYEEYKLMKTIKKGSKGNTVKVWQVIIGANPDGIFGNDTEKLTKKFQSTHKDMNGAALVQDGIVGPKSWFAGLNSLS